MRASRLALRASFLTNFIAHVLTRLGVLPAPGRGITSSGRDLAEFLGREFKCRPPLAGGPLFTLLFQIPAYFEGDSLEDVLEAYSLAERCVASRSFNPLRRALGPALDEWFPQEVEELFFKELGAFDEAKLAAAINLLKGALAEAYDAFKREEWSGMAGRIQRVKSALETALRGVDVIELWEELLSVDFPFAQFAVLLCEPCGTVSSLLAEKVVVPSKASLENLLNAIVHEAGVHFFTPRRLLRHPDLRERYLSDKLGTLRAVEALVCHLKAEILSSVGVRLEQDPFIVGMNLQREVEVARRAFRETRLNDPYEAVLKVLEEGEKRS